MKRRLFALLMAAALMVPMLASCGGKDTPQSGGSQAGGSQTTDADQVYEISLATVYASDHIFAQAMDRMAKELEETSNGRLNVTTYHNSTMGSERDEMDAVAAGTLTMCIAGGGQLGNLYSPLLVFDAPYCIRDNDHLQAIITSDVGREMWDSMAENTSIRPLGGLYLGQRFITTSKTPIYTPEDLKGLKIRVPDEPVRIATFTAFGANPIPMAFSEVYMSLSQNVIDGQENPLTQIMASKFYEVQKYISTTAHVTQVVFLNVNEDFYNSLPDDLKTLLAETAARYCVEASQESVEFEEQTLGELETVYDMTVCEPDIEAFQKLGAGMIQDYASNWGEGLYETIQSIQ